MLYLPTLPTHSCGVHYSYLIITSDTCHPRWTFTLIWQLSQTDLANVFAKYSPLHGLTLPSKFHCLIAWPRQDLLTWMPPQPLLVGRTVLLAFLHSWVLVIPFIPTSFKIDSLIVTSRMVHPYHRSPYGHPAWIHLINPAVPTIAWPWLGCLAFSTKTIVDRHFWSLCIMLSSASMLTYHTCNLTWLLWIVVPRLHLPHTGTLSHVLPFHWQTSHMLPLPTDFGCYHSR